MGLSMEDVRTAIANANAPVAARHLRRRRSRADTIGTNDQLRTRAGLSTARREGRERHRGPARRHRRCRAGRAQQPLGGLVQRRSRRCCSIITKQADANVIETVDRIHALLPELKRCIPAGIEISVLSDRTTTIRASVHDMQLTLGATVVLVMMVVFLFLRRIAATLAAGVTVPLSLAGTCAAMWAAGFSIDNISLMALAISVGFVVDDAIVMIENVFRNLETGMSPLQRGASRARGRSASPSSRSAFR